MICSAFGLVIYNGYVDKRAGIKSKEIYDMVSAISVDLDKNVILVKGSVPGCKGAILKIKSAVKPSALQLILAIDVTLSLLGEIFVIHLAISNVAVVSIGKYILESDIYSLEKLV